MVDINEIKIFTTANDLFQSAAEDFTCRAIAAVNHKGKFTVVVPGGNTPKFFFSALTGIESYKKRIPWRHIEFFFSDERYLPFDSVDSNYRMVNEYLFSKVPILPENIHRVKTEFDDPKEAAKDYEATIRNIFHINENEFPIFDLIFLGLGEDAHTASLMPFSDIVKTYCDNPEPDSIHQLVASLWIPHLSMHRITLTPSAINHGECIIFHATGQSKALAVQHVLKGEREALAYPAQLICSERGKTMWYLDKEAASLLEQ